MLVGEDKSTSRILSKRGIVKESFIEVITTRRIHRLTVPISQIWIFVNKLKEHNINHM